MSLTRLLAIAGAVGLLAAAPGLTLLSKKVVVRTDEPPRSVWFESPEAADVFHRALRRGADTDPDGADGRLPLLAPFSRNRVLSEAARFNDAVDACDADGDGIITLAEAQAFEKLRD